MSKLGINIKIDVSKIDKARLFKGNKGVYMDLTTFIDTQVEGKYGDHGFISQSTDKEEREAGVQTPILGNCKVFFVEGSSNTNVVPPSADSQEPFSDDIPF